MKITIKNFQNKIPISPKRIKKIILKAFSSEGAKKSGEINVCFVNDLKIKKFNLKYLGKNCPTDVLSFLLEPENRGRIFGDIIISTDTAVGNAKIFKTSSLYETSLYIIHGVLHLLGYDDKNARERKLMDNKTNRILAALKLTDG